MASFDTLQKLAEHPDWIAPRSRARVFLGEPGAPEATKTTVEPGNIFSPGMRTFGVTWWLRLPDSGTFFAAETAPLESLNSCYEEGFLPIIHCEAEFSGLRVHHTLFQDGSAKTRSEAVCARLELTNTSAPKALQVFVALRSLGPAGGLLDQLAVDGQTFVGHGLPLLSFDRAPDVQGVGIGDPSPLAREGSVPSDCFAEDGAGWCYGLARFDLELAPSASWSVAFDCPQQTYGNLAHHLPCTVVPRPAQFAERLEAHKERWRALFGGIDLRVPDANFRSAFFAGLQHMLTATVGVQARIAPLSYPLPWLRDSVYIIPAKGCRGRRRAERCVPAPIRSTTSKVPV